MTLDLDVAEVGLGDHGGQGGVELPPQFEGGLDLVLPGAGLQVAPEAAHDGGEVLVQDGGVGVRVRPGHQQLALPHLGKAM